MAPVPYISSQSGPSITVNDWLKDPHRIPVYILDLMKQGFLADAVLRQGGSAQAGVVRFDESTPLYATREAPIRAEGAEVPIVSGKAGIPNVTYTHDRAMRHLVTDEMKRRNRADLVTMRATQISNTMTRTWDDLFVAAVLNNPNIQSQAASAVWSNGATDIRGDLLAAAEKIEGALDEDGSELGYEADTIIVNRATKFDIINSAQFNRVYENGGNLTSEHLQYTGKLPQKILAYDVLFTPRVPAGVVIMCQRQTCGFISDEVPLRAFPMEEDRNRLSWSSIIQRVSAVGIDQPKAVCVVRGVAA